MDPELPVATLGLGPASMPGNCLFRHGKRDPDLESELAPPAGPPVRWQGHTCETQKRVDIPPRQLATGLYVGEHAHHPLSPVSMPATHSVQYVKAHPPD